jgi:hypothetical protein|tara:strand:+ start:2513 stop:2689 length:177 start_codon:yes stop_codon:yes gene_type:complete
MYNLMMKQEQYDKLATLSEKMQRQSLEQIAVADLIRDAIDVYLAFALEENDELENAET